MQEYQVQVFENRTEWYQNGLIHRLDGPAIEYKNGYEEWRINGKAHRLDGPAIKYIDGGKSWYINGKLHRLNGPAVESISGSKYWYIDGIKLTEEQFINKTQPIKEMSIAELEAELGYRIKVIK